MIRGTVAGSVWATKRITGFPSGALLEVELETGVRVVALDVLGSGVGEHVLVATGSVAAAQFPNMTPPIDALIVGSIDQQASDREEENGQ